MDRLRQVSESRAETLCQSHRVTHARAEDHILLPRERQYAKLKLQFMHYKELCQILNSKKLRLNMD